jgi:3-phenylpropionate/trans-cinnamate dioxygenase ferredoxin reductase subunit
MGKRCTMVMTEPVPLCTGFGDAAGAFFEELLRSRGVELVTGDPLERFEGDGRVQRVVTGSGAPSSRLVVMGTGARPDVMLARASGPGAGARRAESPARRAWRRPFPAYGRPATPASTNRCSTTAAASGSSTGRSRWAQGKAAAAAVAGRPAQFAEVPYFWSDLADWCTVEYVGSAKDWDREIVRGSIADGSFSVFYTAGDRLVAALTVGRPEELMQGRRLLADGADLGERRVALLADESTDLAGL